MLKIKLSINTNRLSASADAVLFGVFKIIKVKAFFWEDAFYLKLNGKDYKKIERNPDKKKSNFNFGRPPKLTLKKPVLNLNINSGDNALIPAFSTIAAQNILGNINRFAPDLFQIKKPKITIFPAYEGGGSKVFLSFKPGFYPVKIILHLLRTILVSPWTKKSKV